MALEAGTCTIAPDKTVTGTGLAKAFADVNVSMQSAPGLPPRSCAALKVWCEAMAAAIVSHIIANAEITVTVKTTDAGLQRTPNPNNPNTPTLGPSADVTLSGELT